MPFHSKPPATWPMLHACFCMCCSTAYTTATSRQAFYYHHTLPALWPRTLQGDGRAWGPLPPTGAGDPDCKAPLDRCSQGQVSRALGQGSPQRSFGACSWWQSIGCLAPKLSTPPQLELSLSQMSLMDGSLASPLSRLPALLLTSRPGQC